MFLSNKSKVKFINKISDYFKECESFYISVSFIKYAGLRLVLDDIEDALKRGCKGKLITTSYQYFTDPASLIELNELQKKYPNFECHFDYHNVNDGGFHCKGYIFNINNKYEIVIGSTNITRSALLKNIEWNLSVTTELNEDTTKDVLDEFDFLWNLTAVLDNEIINLYKVEYEFHGYTLEGPDNYISSNVKPNFMQLNALKELRKLRALGERKALLIASTGSGKTYLSAFDASQFEPKRLLYIVHTESILSDAMKTFKKVFGSRATYGFYTGIKKQKDMQFIFSTNITMQKHLNGFDKDEFDYIIIDEVHHAAASTYKKIIDYFEPEFLLGLTATPERMDEKSVYAIFENNVAYELRLRDALLNDLICTFKYYSIWDSLQEEEDEKEINKFIKSSSKNPHYQFIKDNIEKYRNKDIPLRCIGFCRSVDAAIDLANNMNDLGYRTKALTGNNSTEERLQAFSDLENNKLDIIFAPDVLNEGVDIPSVNMVLFLRPTESSIIFTQQLGRGLRKYPGKDYLVVLDFMCNSDTRSEQIAIALGGLTKNTTRDKLYLKNLVSRNFEQLDLPVYIEFDEKSKEHILSQLERANFHTLPILKQEYNSFKKYIKASEPVRHMDYLNTDYEDSLIKFIDKYKSYYNFLISINEVDDDLSTNQKSALIKLSSLLPLVRQYEFLITKYLLDGVLSYNELLEKIKSDIYINIFYKDKFDHALYHLQNFVYSEVQQKDMYQLLICEGEKYRLNAELTEEFISYCKDLLNYGLQKYKAEFHQVSTDLKLYYKYSRESLLNVLNNHTFNFREGILEKEELYLFIDLKKDIDKAEWLKYNDKFMSDSILQWESSTQTTLDNSKGKRLLDYGKAHIFVRKCKKDDGIVQRYYYIGKGKMINPRISDNIKKSILIDFELEHNIPKFLHYDFEINEGDE